MIYSAAGCVVIVLFVYGDRPDYQNFPAEGVFGNCLALILGLILFIGVFLVADFEFRRPGLSNEEM